MSRTMTTSTWPASIAAISSPNPSRLISLRIHGQWAAARAAASVAGGDGAAWLEGDAAQGFACDASVTPIVTGEVNPGAMEDLVRLCVQLAGYGPGRGVDGADPQPPTERGREALEKAIIGKTTILLLRSWSALDVR
jgi:hypothetical protein